MATIFEIANDAAKAIIKEIGISEDCKVTWADSVIIEIETNSIKPELSIVPKIVKEQDHGT